MVYADQYIPSDRHLIASGIAVKIPEKIQIRPYYTDTSMKECNLSHEAYAEKCKAETHAFLAVLCRKIADCGAIFAIHEEGCAAEIILLRGEEQRAEDLKKILAVLGEFPARWVMANVFWTAKEIPGEAEKMAFRIVDAFHDQYIHIGDRTGKLEKNDQGEIIFKKRFSKHYGFKVNPVDLCKEYILNHKHFKRGGCNGPAFADLSEVSYWR